MQVLWPVIRDAELRSMPSEFRHQPATVLSISSNHMFAHWRKRGLQIELDAFHPRDDLDLSPVGRERAVLYRVGGELAKGHRQGERMPGRQPHALAPHRESVLFGAKRLEHAFKDRASRRPPSSPRQDVARARHGAQARLRLARGLTRVAGPSTRRRQRVQRLSRQSLRGPVRHPLGADRAIKVDRRPAVPEHERRSGAGLFRRRDWSRTSSPAFHGSNGSS